MNRSGWRLVLQSSSDLTLAFLVGSLFAIPFLLMGNRQHHDRYTFSKTPSDDVALEKWARSQPGTGDIKISREGDELIFDYKNKNSSPLNPPWTTLGYGGVKTANLMFPFLPVFDMSTAVVILVMCGQSGFLAFGLRRMKVAGRAGALHPAPLEGPVPRAVFAGLGTGAALFAFGWAYGEILHALFGLSSEGMWAAVRSFHPWGKVAIMAVGGLAAPICEEVFFRGGCYGSFAGAGLPRAGSWVSALLFSMAHFNLENAVAYLTIGLVLAWLYRSTRSLVAPIVAHAVNNTAAFALLFLSGT